MFYISVWIVGEIVGLAAILILLGLVVYSCFAISDKCKSIEEQEADDQEQIDCLMNIEKK